VSTSKQPTNRWGRFLPVLAAVFAVVGIVLIVAAQWENFHNADGHFYWPFIDLFPLFIVGCGFLVFAIHPFVWRSVYNPEFAPSASRVLVTAAVLIVASVPATVIVALIVGFIASVLPR
jgi:peptidoglycan/LPS O-acetylase OafA/YrhL